MKWKVFLVLLWPCNFTLTWLFLLCKFLLGTSGLQINHCLISWTEYPLITCILSISIKVAFGLDLHDLLQPAQQIGDICFWHHPEREGLLFIDRLPHIDLFTHLFIKHVLITYFDSSSVLESRDFKKWIRCVLFLLVASNLEGGDPLTWTCSND